MSTIVQCKHVYIVHVCRCVGVCGREEEEEEGVDEGGSVVFLKSAEVASIAGINNDDIFLGKTSSDVSVKCAVIEHVVYLFVSP